MKDIFDKMYEGSYFTLEGCDISNGIDEWVDGINEMMSSKGIGTVPKESWVTFKGKEMNNKYGLSGNNSYPDDLTFLAFPLDGLNVGKLAMFKLQFGARWMDDIVDNNRMRQNEIDGVFDSDDEDWEED